MFSARILMILMALHSVAFGQTFSEFNGECLKRISQAICSTFYSDRLTMCLEKMSDPRRLTLDKPNKKICLTSNPKVCILEKICPKSNSADSNSKNQEESRSAEIGASGNSGAPEVTTTTAATPTTTLEETTTTAATPTTTLEVTTTTAATPSTTTTTTSAQVSLHFSR